MRTSLLSLLALPAIAAAQNITFLASLTQALQALNLTQTLQAVVSLNNSAVGLGLLTNISSGNPFLIFAPTDDAWANAPANVTGNQTALTQAFAYHIVEGNFTGINATVYPNNTLGQTLLNDPEVVQLEANKSQAVAWAQREDGAVHILNQINDTRIVGGPVNFGNLTIFTIDNVLNIPENLTTTIPLDNNSISEFETYLNATQLAFFNATTNQTSDITFLEAFNSGYKGYTLFIPNNTAVAAVNDTLQSLLQNNRTGINAVMFNHLINGTTLYSPFLTGSQNFTSQGGEPFSFSINGTGQYVTLANVTAQIIQPDVLFPNGVAHIISDVLLNEDADGAAAASALSSVISAQSTATATPSGPLGFAITSSLAAAATPSANSSSSTTPPPSSSVSTSTASVAVNTTSSA